ncbi:hypothetical protein [Stenotrophomonas maltophilia]|uniref:hypothetical protein n=1 Tax=Stenotrophomonas maltophilia TaxID=40324 RepID=UPI000C15E848|nr:hypothetical protein [Stenotrophomonas maltophilia]
MAIEFCPLADDVGNLADWAAVFVGAIAAIATTVVAVLAYKTSDRATDIAQKAKDIAEKAKDIAQQQHQEAADLRDAQARILGKRLRHEVTHLALRVGGLLRQLDSAVSFVGLPHIENGDKLVGMLDEASMPLLPGGRAVEDRIHNLPDALGADLATLIGADQTLEERVRNMRARLHAVGPDSPWAYGGETTDFLILKNHLDWIRGLATNVALQFISFELEGRTE